MKQKLEGTRTPDKPPRTTAKRNTLGGDRTHDHKIKSLALYHLSYEGNSYGGKMVENPGFDPGASRLQSAHSTD